MTTNFGRMIPALMATSLFSLASSAMGEYSHTAFAEGPIGSSQVPLPNTVSYDYSFISGQQQKQATISISSNPIAAVSMVSQVANPVGEIQLTSGGTLRYTFEVMAQPFTTVPINFLGVFSAFQNGQGGLSLSQVSFDIFSTNSNPANTPSRFAADLRASCGVANGCASFTATGSNTSYSFAQFDQYNINGSFYGSIQFLTNANGQVAGAISLAAVSTVRAFPGSGSSSAYIDPRIEIDAAFLAMNPGATLTITPGVGNEISPIPELSTLSMLLAGLGLLGFRGRRMRAVG